MPKRFTATEKWIDPWFCSLTPINKLFWIYLLDNCDHAGIWKVNWPLVKFHLWEEKIDPELFSGRIIVLSSDKWYIPKFIEFQYGELNETNNTHKSVLKILEKEGVFEGLDSPLAGLQYKGLDKGLDKDKGIVKGDEKVKYLDFVFLSKANYDQLAQKLGSTRVDQYIDKLNNYIGSKGKKYKSHYHTILSWASKDDGIKSLTSSPAKPIRPKKNADAGCPICNGTGKMSGGTDCPCTQ